MYDDVRTGSSITPSELARSRISLSFAEAREMETGDRRGNAEMLVFNQGTGTSNLSERFSPRVVNRTA